MLTKTLYELDNVKSDNHALQASCDLLSQDLRDKEPLSDGLRKTIRAMTTQIRDLQAENCKLRSRKPPTSPSPADDVIPLPTL